MNDNQFGALLAAINKVSDALDANTKAIEFQTTELHADLVDAVNSCDEQTRRIEEFLDYLKNRD